MTGSGKKMCLAAAVLGLASAAAQAATTGNTIEIVPGTTIDRSLADAAAVNYAYGPKQTFDAGTGLTKVYLPYGDADGVYFDLNTVGFTAPAAEWTDGNLHSVDGGQPLTLKFKIHFAEAISQFSVIDNGFTQFDLNPGNTGGLAYSTDGTTWSALKEVTAGGVYDPFLPENAPVIVSGLNTQDLYLNFYTTNTTGGSSWVQARTVGAPGWGEADFFNSEWQLNVATVPEPASLGLLGLSGLAMLRRRVRRACRLVRNEVHMTGSGKKMCLAAAVLGLGSAAANAATFVYSRATSNTAGTADQWTAGTNWDVTPISATDSELWLSDATLAAGDTIFTNNDNAGVFQLLKLNCNYVGSAAGPAPQVTVSGGDLEVGDRLNFFNVGGVVPVYTVSNNLKTTAGGDALILVDAPLSATVSGNLTGNGFTKAGEGDLTLTGTASSVKKLTNVGGGILNLAGTVNVTQQLTTTGFGGTLTAITNSSGSTSTNWLVVGDGQTGIFNVTGGTMTNNGDVSIGAGALGTVHVSSGAMSVAVGKALYVGAGWNGSADGTGVLTVSGTGAVDTLDLWAIRLGPDGTATGTGTVNLDGGIFSANTSITKGNSANATAIFNFNGGKLRTVWDNANLMSGLTSANVKAGGAVIDTQGFTVGIGQPLLAASANGGLTKQGLGMLTLGGVNTYTGNTVVSEGTFALADNAGLMFVIGANGVNNSISGVGILTLDGDFTFDLSGAAAVGSWTIVDVDALSETFGSSFQVNGFSEVANVWTSGNYTFSEATGVLSTVPEPASIGLAAAGGVLLLGRRRARKA